MSQPQRRQTQPLGALLPRTGRLVRLPPSPSLRRGFPWLRWVRVCLGAGKAEEGVTAYSLLEHEDANDEGEGDQVGDDPHEAVLVRGLWTDGRGSSSHGRPTLGSRLRAQGREDPVTAGEGQGTAGRHGLRVPWAWVRVPVRMRTAQGACAVLRVEVVCVEPVHSLGGGGGFVCFRGLKARGE